LQEGGGRSQKKENTALGTKREGSDREQRPGRKKKKHTSGKKKNYAQVKVSCGLFGGGRGNHLKKKGCVKASKKRKVRGGQHEQE